MKAVAAASVLAWMASSVQAAPNPSEAALIASLIQAVAAAQDLVFIRNGSDSTPADAAKHLRDKFDYFRKDIGTADDFIRLCGTRSELSKQPYQVRLANGTLQPSAEWLHTRLQGLRAKSK